MRKTKTLLAAALTAAVAGTIAVLTATSTAGATPATAANVNAAGMSPTTVAVAASISRSNEKYAFDYLVGKGWSKKHAAAIVGNLDQESGMSPTIHQTGGGPGRGIAQWSVGGRWDTAHNDNVLWYARQHHRSATSLSLQLDFIRYELRTFSYYGKSHLVAATTINGGVKAFAKYYEGCGTCVIANREAYAHDAYNRYA